MLFRYNISRKYYECLALRSEMRPRSQNDRLSQVNWLANINEDAMTASNCLSPVPFDWTTIVTIVSVVMAFLTLCTFTYCMCKTKKRQPPAVKSPSVYVA